MLLPPPPSNPQPPHTLLQKRISQKTPCNNVTTLQTTLVIPFKAILGYALPSPMEIHDYHHHSTWFETSARYRRRRAPGWPTSVTLVAHIAYYQVPGLPDGNASFVCDRKALDRHSSFSTAGPSSHSSVGGITQSSLVQSTSLLGSL